MAALVSLGATAPATAGEPFARRLELGLFPEMTIVGGLAGGARVELLLSPGPPGTAHRLRLAPGFLEGPEFHYVPVALGYRAIFRSTQRVRPVLGTGLEYQLRWVSDAPAANQIAWYGELGLMVAPRPDLAIGLIAQIDWTFFGGPGFGVSARLGVLWRPWAARPAGGTSP